MSEAVLTPREIQIEALLLNGMTNKQVAERLGISPRTVEVHRAHILEKRGVGRAVQIVSGRLAALIEAAEAVVADIDALRPPRFDRLRDAVNQAKGA